MSNVSVEVHGKRHAVHVSPMAPLTAVISAALAAEGVTADPAACKLLLGKRELDTATPLRFANLPTGAKLQLVTGQERRLGMGEPIAAPRLPDSPNKAANSPRAADAAAAPYTMAPSSKQLSSGAAAAGGAAPAEAAQPAPPSPSAAAAAAQQQLPAVPEQPAGPSGGVRPMGAAGAPGQSGAATQQPADVAASSGVADATAAEGAAAGPQPDLQLRQLLGRPAYVFSRAAAQEAEPATTSVDDPPDSFYEFTADDYARVARGWGANFATGPPASAPLKTGRIRAAEAAAAAEKLGPVPVRVLGLADGLALQATFAAADPVSALQDLVARAVLPDMCGLQLYTAPPKAVLQRPQATLYEAGLAPAAVVYAGCSGDGSPALRPEVAALQGPPPQRERRPRGNGSGQKRATAAAAAQAGSNGAASAPQQSGEAKAQDAPRSASGAKLPKWLQPKK